MITRRRLLALLLASPLARLLPVRPAEAEVFPAGIDPVQSIGEAVSGWDKVYTHRTFSLGIPITGTPAMEALITAEEARMDSLLNEAIWNSPGTLLRREHSQEQQIGGQP